MPIFYFDTLDGDSLFRDDLGLEFEDLNRVRYEATRALAELANEVLPGKLRRRLAIEVRNESDERVLRASLAFEVAPPP